MERTSAPKPAQYAQDIADELGWTYAGKLKSGHRRFEWNDSNGNLHVVTTGSGAHSDRDGRIDAQKVRSRIRKCMAGDCHHIDETEGASNEAPEGPPTFFRPGDEVLVAGQPASVIEEDGEHAVVVNHMTGDQDIVPVAELVKQAKEEFDPSGMSMIFLEVPESGLETPEDAHLTLFSFEDLTGEEKEALAGAMAEVPHSKMRGTLSGYSLFGEDEDILVAEIDLPEAQDLYDRLKVELDEAGLEYKDDYDFKPHITLERGFKGELPDPEPIEFVFDTMSIAHGDCSQEENVTMTITAFLRHSTQDSVPEPPGTVPVPEGWMRLYHYTGASPEELLRDGISIERARGESYGEGNWVWASTKLPSSDHRFIEFSVPADDPSIVVGFDSWRSDMPDFQEYIDYFMDRGSDLAFNRSIRPEEFIAIHEPWHETYRYLKENYPEPTDEFDSLAEQSPEDHGRAIKLWKQEGGAGL